MLTKLPAVPVLGAVVVVALTAAAAALMLYPGDQPAPVPSTRLAAEHELPSDESVPDSGPKDDGHHTHPAADNPALDTGQQPESEPSLDATPPVTTTTLPKGATSTTHSAAHSSPTTEPAHSHESPENPSGDEAAPPEVGGATPTTTLPKQTTTTTTHSPTTSEPTHDHGSPITAPPPSGPTRLVIARDSVINTRLMLRPGDSIEFRNGARLMFGPGGYADWQGTPTSTWSNDGRTQNLERDVVIFGAGDIMFMEGSLPSTIKYVEVDLRPKQELGHYPLHWHQAGDSVRGTVVEGVVVKDSTNRAYVPHGSNGITIKDSIAKNIIGEAFWWDLTIREQRQAGQHPNASHDIVWDHNLADGVFDTPLEGNVRLAAFVLGDGKSNVLTDSVARNVQSDRKKDCAGFNWPEGIGAVWKFENNRAIGGNCNGIFVWQNNKGDHVVEGFSAVGVGQACIRHGAYANNYRYINTDCERVEILAGQGDTQGPRFEGGRVGHVVFEEHRLSGVVQFVNTQVNSVMIDNGRLGSCGSKHHPGTYIFNNTGLSLEEITTAQICPGTKVFLNGIIRDFR